MMEDIRKILEAVASGEISPEEGEMLIKALKEGEKDKKEKKETKEKDKIFVVENNEVVNDDLVISGEKVIIKGTVNGDVVLLYCDTEFSGTVNGDTVIIGGKVHFEGGEVNGDLVLIGAKFSGEEPEVGGDFVKITNFLATGILTALSPILKSINIRGSKKKKIKSFDRKTKFSFKGFTEFNVSEGDKVDVGILNDLKRVVVDGELSCKTLEAKEIVVGEKGKLISPLIKAEIIKVEDGGNIKTKFLWCQKLIGSGKVFASKISADYIEDTLNLIIENEEN